MLLEDELKYLFEDIRQVSGDDFFPLLTLWMTMMIRDDYNTWKLNIFFMSGFSFKKIRDAQNFCLSANFM